MVRVCDMDTVASVVQKACEKASLKVDQCFLLLRRITSPNEVYIPEDAEPLQPKVRQLISGGGSILAKKKCSTKLTLPVSFCQVALRIRHGPCKFA